MAWREQTVDVRPEDEGMRLDQFLSLRLPQLSRSRVQALIGAGNVSVDNRFVKSSHRVRENEKVRVIIEPIPSPAVQPEKIPLVIIYEDEHLLVIDKPAGMVVHPAAGVHTGTLVNALMAHSPFLSRAGGADRPGIVHRLDKNTSGLIIVAKSEAAHRALVERISARAVRRRYRALAYGEFSELSGTIDAPIGRSPSDRKKMAVTGTRSRKAITHFSVSETFPAISDLMVTLDTGRTHQIRVHMAYIGHPIVGDTVYGVRLKRFHEKMNPEVVDRIKRLDRHMLHAESLEFAHPLTDEPMRFVAPLPAEFAAFLELLRKAGEKRAT
jgi:23S rRNA pseudouridine1911/1915/1917 synthase